jgi:cell filamentation protein
MLNKLRDPYLYDDADVLRNRLNIKDAKQLEKAEADITFFRLSTVDGAVESLPFDITRLKAIHMHIFSDIYAWAGSLRNIAIVKGERVLGGDTVRYSQPDNIERDFASCVKKLQSVDWTVLDANGIAEIFSRLVAEMWQVHPFREGNTRTTITFSTQFAEAHGFRMDRTLLKDSASYVRDALVKASDGAYSDNSYLQRIFADSILRG